MEQIIKDFFQETFNISNNKTLDILALNSTIVHIKGKRTLFEMDDEVDVVYFFYSGFSYAYFNKTKTRKLIERLYYKKGWMIPFTPEKKSEYNIYCPIDTRFVVTPFAVLQELLETSLEIKDAQIQLLSDLLTFQKNTQYLRTFSPKERVKSFFEMYHDYTSFMTNTEIAAYLDMSRAEFVKTLKSINSNN